MWRRELWKKLTEFSVRGSSDVKKFCQTKQRHIAQNSIFHIYCCTNRDSHNGMCTSFDLTQIKRRDISYAHTLVLKICNVAVWDEKVWVGRYLQIFWRIQLPQFSEHIFVPTRCHIPEDHNIHSLENLKFHICTECRFS
jgi:hypothetical protein